jgi:uncharacterized protein (TIGR01777 family)
MQILITGGTGFIGSALVPELVRAGHRVWALTRQERSEVGAVIYVRDLESITGDIDGVINLAGASLAGRRWNDAYKAEIVSSRLEMTRSLGAYFSARDTPPAWWINASAIGFYGPRGDEVLGEDAPAGQGFSAQLCRDWEAAAREACPEATRLCLLRLGVVLDRDGGAYPQMAAPFRMGVANWVGSGQQYLSWVHRNDVVGAILHIIAAPDLSGPVNVTAPAPATSREFCAAMKRQHRTFLTLPMPAPVMRTMVGEMADELLLTGQRVVPAALLESGFEFAFPNLEGALSAIEA